MTKRPNCNYLHKKQRQTEKISLDKRQRGLYNNF